MTNPPKQKGTGGEREVMRECEDREIPVRRMPAGATYDLEVGRELVFLHDALATRPDRGEWLLTMRLEDALQLIDFNTDGLRVEVKRYARFSLHTIFQKKFGRKS